MSETLVTENAGTGRVTISPGRASLASMIVLVAILAVDFAAIRAASSAWTAIVMIAGIVVLLTSVLGVIFCSARMRAFCIGFATFGCTFFAIMHVSSMWPNDNFGRPPQTLWRDSVDALLEPLALRLHPEPIVLPAGPTTAQQQTKFFQERAIAQYARRNCHLCLEWSALMALALLGGAVGLAFGAVRSRSEASID